MTGWRVGYVYAAERILDQIMKIHDAVAICAPSLSQHAALAALKGGQECVAAIKAVLQLRRDLVCERLDRLEECFDYVRPQGAYYLMARHKLRHVHHDLRPAPAPGSSRHHHPRGGLWPHG